MSRVIYSPGRAKQLRVLLWATVVIGALLAGLAMFVLLAGGSAPYALFVAVPAALLLVCSVTGLKKLEARGRTARVWAVVTGVLLVLLGLLTAQAAMGILPSIVGVLMLLMALLPDVGDQ